MRTTGRKGLFPASCRRDPKNSSEQQGIGSKNIHNREKEDKGALSIENKFSNGGWSTGQSHQWVHVTQEVINDIGSTEGELGDKENRNWISKESNEPAERHQPTTEVPSHDGGVVQWAADGQVPIISHDTEEEAFSCAQGNEEVELSETTREGYGLGFGKKIDQHVGDCAGHIPDF